MIQTVIKRDGRKEPFNPQKCNDWIKWASVDIQEHVDWSSIVLKTIRTLPEEVTAKQLQDGMIRTCLDMNSYGYNKMAGRLYSQALKKEIYAWSKRDYPTIKTLHERMIKAGVIVKPNYSDEEYLLINKMLHHERDLTYAHYSLHLLVSKYALQDRVRKVAYETPQFAMMRVAMQAMNNYHEVDRMKKLEELYTHISFQRLCVPTPYWSGGLSANPNAASCCVIKCDDTADSIGVATTLAYSMTCAGAGIGMNMNTRSLGAAVRGGVIQHTGKIPYYRYAAAAVKSSKQGCYDDTTEILTDKGWKLGVELTEDDIVAQVNDNLQVSFVKPLRLVNYHHKGDMYHFTSKGNGMLDLLVTPDHDMPYKKVRHVVSEGAVSKAINEGMTQLTETQWVDSKFSEEKAETFSPNRLHALYISGLAHNEETAFTQLDRLSVVYQADGYTNKGSNFIQFKFKKQRKIDRLLSIISDMKYDVHKDARNDTIIKVYVPDTSFFTKDFSQFDLSKKNHKWLKEFVLETSYWDATYHDSTVGAFTYMNTNKAAVDAVQMAVSLSGGSSFMQATPPKKMHHSIRFRLSVSYWKNHICSSHILKEKKQYDGRVWCVEVPNGKVIVRRNGITAVNKNSRGGALTMYYSFTDPELFDLLILKNPLTVTAKRLRELDYGVIVNKWLFQRAAKKQDIYLFDSSVAPELYESIYTDTPEVFEEKMMKFASEHPDKVKAVPALDVLKAIMKERMETGRVYLFFADENNRHTPFKETIYSSNLCSEISLITKGYNSFEDLYKTDDSVEGVVAFCNLAGIVLDHIENDEQYQEVAYYALLLIDEGINNSDLNFPQLNKSIRDWRSAGVGVLGLAHLMAKKGLSYSSQEGRDYCHRLAERHSFMLHKAAVKLAKERGIANNSHRTKYPEGWLPIDTYNRNVDELTNQTLHYDWESLREEIKQLGGIRFTVLETIPPSETSSQSSETTNGIYPIREGSIVKVSGDTTTNFVAPEYETLKDKYDIAWEVPTKDMISIYAIWQKFISQGISCDFWIDRSKNRDVSTKQLIQELFWCNKYGLKGNYYYNTKMDADVVAGAIASTTFEENEPTKEQQDEPGCGSGGCTL